MEPFDLQLNGYKGVDFNSDDLTGESLRYACAAVRADGGGRMLATVITDSLEQMTARIHRLVELRTSDPLVREVLVGIHVEGPFISPLPGFVGAHPAEHVVPASIEAAERLVAAGEGLVRLVTLAPEHDADCRTIHWLADQEILVSAGHCDPAPDVLDRAVDHGLTAFTHLGNGCPLTLHRHDNIIHRVLAADRLRWVMVIADGVHLPPLLVRTIIRAVGIDRMIAISDATAAGGMGAGRFTLASRPVVVDANGAAWAPDRSHLLGSTASMGRIREVLATDVGLDADEIIQVTARNPARALFVG